MQKKVYVASAVRTAVGGFAGSLASMPPITLATKVSQEAIQRSGIPAAQIDNVVFGHVINTEPRDMYLSRVAAVDAGVPVESPSRGPHSTQTLRHGQKMGDVAFSDMMLGALHDPFGHGHMGITAENIANKHAITREQQDEFAVQSHQRAAKAVAEGVFKDQIVPVEIKTRKGSVIFDTDEHVRADASLEGMASLRAVFKKDGSVTAGNSSGINDGAAALVLMSEDALAKSGATALAEIVGYAHAGVEPELMGMGPVPAVQALSARTGIAINDFDIVESNEAFAAQACAVSKLLQLDPAIVNPNGGAVGLGHPVGATGAILAVKAIYEMQRIEKQLALVTMCIGGGQGIALALKRVA